MVGWDGTSSQGPWGPCPGVTWLRPNFQENVELRRFLNDSRMTHGHERQEPRPWVDTCFVLFFRTRVPDCKTQPVTSVRHRYHLRPLLDPCSDFDPGRVSGTREPLGGWGRFVEGRRQRVTFRKPTRTGRGTLREGTHGPFVGQ